MKNKYAILTVDTEALPNRAEDDHVNRLMLGIHGKHRAGIMEMASIAAEANVSMLFFVDMCGSWIRREEIGQIIASLSKKGMDAQLHAHPEYLPESFWQEHALNKRPYYMNEYPPDRADFMLKLLAEEHSRWTGEPVRAFRAGSFRWNSAILESLAKLGIRYSFNNSMCAVHNQQCPFSLPTNAPYQWSNGIIEIPVTEKHIFSFLGTGWWARLQYPQSKYFRFRSPLFSFLPNSASREINPAIFLIHSWSFLHRNKQGYEVFRSGRPMENFRKLVRLLQQEYDIITSKDLDYLIEKGEIKTSHVEDIHHADHPPKKSR